MPFVARNYPVARGASNAGFGGSSYGAVAALNTVLVKPGVFGRLLLESPSLYVGGAYLLRRERKAERWPMRVYLGVGTRETSRPDWNEETVGNVLQAGSDPAASRPRAAAPADGRRGRRDPLGRRLGRAAGRRADVLVRTVGFKAHWSG